MKTRTTTDLWIEDGFGLKVNVHPTFATLRLYPEETANIGDDILSVFLNDENEAAILEQAFNDIKRLREQAVPDQEPAGVPEPVEATD